jgi:hypothetical protein
MKMSLSDDEEEDPSALGSGVGVHGERSSSILRVAGASAQNLQEFKRNSVVQGNSTIR